MVSYFNLPIEIYRDTDTYIAECPSIQWAFSQWDTPEEAIVNLREVIAMIQDYESSQDILSSYLVTSKKIILNLPIVRELAYD